MKRNQTDDPLCSASANDCGGCLSVGECMALCKNPKVSDPPVKHGWRVLGILCSLKALEGENVCHMHNNGASTIVDAQSESILIERMQLPGTSRGKRWRRVAYTVSTDHQLDLYDYDTLVTTIVNNGVSPSNRIVRLSHHGKRVSQCPMLTHRCIICNEDVIIGGPMCSKHTKEVYGVFTDQTNLLDSDNQRFKFRGLFADRLFLPDEKICPYITGAEISAEECDLVYDPYKYRSNTSLNYRNIASLANTVMKRPRKDSIDRMYTTSDGSSCNSVLKDGWLLATTNIEPGTEILNAYYAKRREYLEYTVSELVVMYEQPV